MPRDEVTLTDLLTRAVVERLAALNVVAQAIRRVMTEDRDSKVTFSAMGAAIAPALDRVPSPHLYRDIQQACRLLGLRTSKAFASQKVIRGIRLR